MFRNLYNLKRERIGRLKNMGYICYRCKKEVDINLTEALPGVKCPHCGQRILFKGRPPIIKRLKSR